jgi:hypothetical protein
MTIGRELSSECVVEAASAQAERGLREPLGVAAKLRRHELTYRQPGTVLVDSGAVSADELRRMAPLQ